MQQWSYGAWRKNKGMTVRDRDRIRRHHLNSESRSGDKKVEQRRYLPALGGGQKVEMSPQIKSVTKLPDGMSGCSMNMQDLLDAVVCRIVVSVDASFLAFKSYDKMTLK